MQRPPARDPGADLRVVGREGLCTFLYGNDRRVLLAAAFAVARLVDPSPYWVDIRETAQVVDPGDPVGRGWIPDDHLYIVEKAEARPQDAEASPSLWSVIRADESGPLVSELVDFLRLPRTLQEAVSRSRNERRAPVFVLANVDRVRPYYPTVAEGVRPFLDSILRAGVVPIFAAVGPPGAGRWAFDLVFEVRTDPAKDWRTGALACERAPPGDSVARGQVLPLGSVPGVAEALGAA